jgi:uncharacterized protein YigE (DUF2233 family)
MIARAALLVGLAAGLTVTAAWGGMARRVAFQGHTFDTFTVDLAADPLAVYFKDGKNRYRSISAVRERLKRQGRKLVFAMNGGIFEPSHEPSGLYVEHGTEVHPLNLQSGKGNFFLKPNGVFVLAGGHGWIVESGRYAALAKRVEVSYALQSGPLMMGQGKLHPGFLADATSVNIRNGVGMLSAGRAVFAISNQPVTFRQFALFFKDKMNCSDALYLDGSISRMYAPDLGRVDLGGDFATIIGVADRP